MYIHADTQSEGHAFAQSFRLCESGFLQATKKECMMHEMS